MKKHICTAPRSQKMQRCWRRRMDNVKRWVFWISL